MTEQPAENETEAYIRLTPRFVFSLGERVKGYNIVGEVVAQVDPWTVTVRQDRGPEISVLTELLSKA